MWRCRCWRKNRPICWEAAAITDGDRWSAIGGWSEGAPDGSGARAGLAHVRKLAVHPDHIRRGVGQAMMPHIHAAIQRVGMTRVRAEASMTAVEFYHALGYRGAGRVVIDTLAGAFVAQRMNLTFEQKKGPLRDATAPLFASACPRDYSRLPNNCSNIMNMLMKFR